MQYDPTNPDYLSELLSAYLDGEVTDEERTLVEQQLAENTEFRQLHDELMALRAGLESLPRYQLKEDLAPVVLRRAEKAMLAAPSVSHLGNVSHADQAVALAEPSPVLDRIARTARAMRWSLVAIAVAVMIMIFNAQKEGDLRNRELAKVDQTAKMESSTEISAAPMGKLADQNKEFGEPRSKSDDNSLDLYKRDREETSEIAQPMTLGVEESRGGRGVGGGEAAVERYAGKSAAPSAAITNGLTSQVDGDFLVVRCDINVEAAQSNAFEELLEKQQIAVLPNEQPVWYADGKRKNSGARSARSFETFAEDGRAVEVPAKNESSPQLAKPALKLSEKPASKSESSESQSKRGSTSGNVTPAEGSPQQEPQNVNGYLVEASPDQIRATLDSLKNRKDLFATVEEEWPTAETQRLFAPTDVDVPVDSNSSEEKAAGVGVAGSLRSVNEVKRQLGERSRPLQVESKRDDSKVLSKKSNEPVEEDFDTSDNDRRESGFAKQLQQSNVVGANARRVFFDQQLPQAGQKQAPAATKETPWTYEYRQSEPLGGGELRRDSAEDEELSDRKAVTDQSSASGPTTIAAPLSAPADFGKDQRIEADKSGSTAPAAPPMRVLFLLRVVPPEKAAK